MPFTESCRQQAIEGVEPTVRGIGWCYTHRKWCGADIEPELTDEGKAELASAHQKAIAVAVAARRFSSQLLAWSRDPSLMGTVPNEAMLAGVLVELCERTTEMERRFGICCPAQRSGGGTMSGHSPDCQTIKYR